MSAVGFRKHGASSQRAARRARGTVSDDVDPASVQGEGRSSEGRDGASLHQQQRHTIQVTPLDDYRESGDPLLDADCSEFAEAYSDSTRSVSVAAEIAFAASDLAERMEFMQMEEKNPTATTESTTVENSCSLPSLLDLEEDSAASASRGELLDVRQVAGRGRGIFAASDIPKATTLLACEPLVFALNPASRALYCDVCLSSREKMQRCSRCQVWYIVLGVL